MGYETIISNFDELKKADTIFMEPKAFLLDEVVVGNAESIIRKAHDNIEKNYNLAPYFEKFFMRCLLKQNHKVVRLQDIYGRWSRNKMFKISTNDQLRFEIEILNMRKTGFKEKKDIIYFEFMNFSNLLTVCSSVLLTSREQYEFSELKSNDIHFRKIKYIAKNTQGGQRINGHFVINKEDYAITQFNLSFYDDIETIAYQEKKGHKFRTVLYNIDVNYRKNEIKNKYYLSSAEIDARLEMLEDKEIESAIYDFKANLFITNSFTNEKINSNFSLDKDIFKAKFPYSQDFWTSQNQLLLTTELKDFLKQVSENKENKKEFEITGNQ